ncbi:hypothetical protein F751_0942 [Auxenochlorella protothecoides]|uniref:Uncharacterized protein n=1 Tax=Auxenochlorella protothecoides TaxID=3075 RepID=A0A087SDC4_AUXPR|nr:hypothetical protein F751_0942 [Auxenochlorella protothecoides]KFM23728.1 hypothetical protein F751_0942 [Auxenochlorella protothecoides]
MRKRTRASPIGGGALERLDGRRWPSARRPQRESTAAPPQKPTPQRHIARLFSLLSYKQGLEAVHIPGTLTTLLALLQRHEKYNKDNIEKLTGLQLPTEREWNMYTAVEVLKVLNLEKVCATDGTKITAKKRRAIETRLHSKLEEFEVEGCGLYSAGHWRTNGYSVSVTLRRQRGPPRPGDPPPRPPDTPKTSGKRDRSRAPLGAPKGRGIADEYYRQDPPPDDARIDKYVGIDPGRTKMCPTHKTASTEVLLLRVAWIIPYQRRGLAWRIYKKPFRKQRHHAYVGRERAINWQAEQFHAPPRMTTIVCDGVEERIEMWDTKRCNQLRQR